LALLVHVLVCVSIDFPYPIDQYFIRCIVIYIRCASQQQSRTVE